MQIDAGSITFASVQFDFPDIDKVIRSSCLRCQINADGICILDQIWQIDDRRPGALIAIRLYESPFIVWILFKYRDLFAVLDCGDAAVCDTVYTIPHHLNDHDRIYILPFRKRDLDKVGFRMIEGIFPTCIQVAIYSHGADAIFIGIIAHTDLFI